MKNFMKIIMDGLPEKSPNRFSMRQQKVEKSIGRVCQIVTTSKVVLTLKTWSRMYQRRSLRTWFRNFVTKCVYHDGNRDGIAFKISEMGIFKVDRCRNFMKEWVQKANAPRKSQNYCRRARGSGGGFERFTMTQEIEMILPRTRTIKAKDQNRSTNVDPENAQKDPEAQEVTSKQSPNKSVRFW
jgi:hypothetical protein